MVRRRDYSTAAGTTKATVWSKHLVALGTFLLLGCSLPSGLAKEEEYGVDVSFPIHKWEISTNCPWLPHNVDPANNPTPKKYQDIPLQPLGDRQAAYDTFLQGCKDHYGKKGRACTQTEQDRIAMSLRQPQSMQNYTDVGFKKIKAPAAVFKLIKEFWEKNQNQQSEERWPVGNTYTNHWVAPTYIVSVEDKSLRGGGYQLKKQYGTQHETPSRSGLERNLQNAACMAFESTKRVPSLLAMWIGCLLCRVQSSTWLRTSMTLTLTLAN